MEKNDIYFMREAIKRAERGAKLGEVPVGAVIVRDGRIISSGYNRRESGRDALLHAELIAIKRACKKTGAWRLSGCTLYVTMEPCPMCAGAVINARIDRVVYGCADAKAGVYGSVFDIREHKFNHYYQARGGVLADECARLLSGFFADLRLKKAKEKRGTDK